MKFKKFAILTLLSIAFVLTGCGSKKDYKEAFIEDMKVAMKANEGIESSEVHLLMDLIQSKESPMSIGLDVQVLLGDDNYQGTFNAYMSYAGSAKIDVLEAYIDEEYIYINDFFGGGKTKEINTIGIDEILDASKSSQGTGELALVMLMNYVNVDGLKETSDSKTYALSFNYEEIMKLVESSYDVADDYLLSNKEILEHMVKATSITITLEKDGPITQIVIDTEIVEENEEVEFHIVMDIANGTVESIKVPSDLDSYIEGEGDIPFDF